MPIQTSPVESFLDFCLESSVPSKWKDVPLVGLTDNVRKRPMEPGFISRLLTVCGFWENHADVLKEITFVSRREDELIYVRVDAIGFRTIGADGPQDQDCDIQELLDIADPWASVPKRITAFFNFIGLHPPADGVDFDHAGYGGDKQSVDTIFAISDALRKYPDVGMSFYGSDRSQEVRILGRKVSIFSKGAWKDVRL